LCSEPRALNEILTSELQQAELDDANRDREIAMKPTQMPADLYDKAKVYVTLAEPIIVLGLDDISIRGLTVLWPPSI